MLSPKERRRWLACVQGSLGGLGGVDGSLAAQADVYDIPGHIIVRFCHQLRGVAWQADHVTREAAAALCERVMFYKTTHATTTLEEYAPLDMELLEGQSWQPS